MSTATLMKKRWLPLAAGVAAIAAIILRQEEEEVQAGELEPELPMFSLQQVQRQSLIVFRHGVYEVADFAGDHPGGTKILQDLTGDGQVGGALLAAVGAAQASGVPETLEELRVGNLSQQDFDWMKLVKSKALSRSDWSNNDALLKLFFIEGATSSPPPEVDAQTFELKVAGMDRSEASLSLADLKTRFKQHQVTTTIRCATPQAGGNGVARVRVPADWSGVLLADVLEDVGGKPEGAEHVRFEALDTDAQGRPFGGAIPVTTALDRGVGVLLAYEMNGAPIPKEHGFPLHVVVPGKTGARNVKFVHRIILT